MNGTRNKKLKRLLLFSVGLFLFQSNMGFARIRLFSPRTLVPTRRRLPVSQNTTRAPIQRLQPLKVASSPTDSDHADDSIKEVPPQARPIAQGHNVIKNEQPEPAKIKPAFGRSIAQALQNRPKLFQAQLRETPIDPYTAIFCENPQRLVCETSLDNVAGTSWPEHIFPRGPQPAFNSGKKLLSYLTEHYFDYSEGTKKAVQNQLFNTQILVTNTSGPMAYSAPPRVEVPPTYWNLFSVFHELGHMIDFKSTYPLNKEEVIQVLRKSGQPLNVDTIEALIKDKGAEITADKIAAKGFAFLADPHLRKLGYEPLNSASLLKTLKSAMGFLCSSPGSPEHPSGKFRINFIGADEDLRAVLGCPVPK